MSEPRATFNGRKVTFVDKERREREKYAVNRGHYILSATHKDSTPTSLGPKVKITPM
jgi:hypothetical protein